MGKLDQEPELEELCELIAGLELIQSVAESARGADPAVNDSLNAIAAIAIDLTEMVRSLDETNVFDLEKIQKQMDEKS
jgi:hypothetical protein